MRDCLTKIAIISSLSMCCYAGNGDLPAITPVTNAVFACASTNVYKEVWTNALVDNDLDKIWNMGIRMLKISVQWYLPHGSKNNLSNKPQPYLALCYEKPHANNCPITKIKLDGKDPQKIAQLFEKLATLLQNNANEVFILKIVNNMSSRSSVNGARGFSDDKMIKLYKHHIESSGLGRFVLTLNNRTNPLTLGEMRSTGKRLIIIDTKWAAQLPHYLTSNKNYAAQIKCDNNLLKNCVLNNIDKNSNSFIENRLSNDIKEQIKSCYSRNAVKPDNIINDFIHLNNLTKAMNDINRRIGKTYR